MGELDGLDDFETMGLKGEALVEDGTEVEEFGTSVMVRAPLGSDVGWGIRGRRRFWT